MKKSRAFEIKKAWNSAYCTSGTGIPSNNKRAHAVRREHRTYYLVAKITSFLVRDSKRMLQICFEESQIYVFNNKDSNLFSTVHYRIHNKCE